MERWRSRERWRWSWSWRLAFLLAGCSLAGAPASAAQRVTARLGELERSVAVPALADFARTGAINPDLRFFLDRLKPAQREDLRTALSQPLPVTTVMVANFLSRPLGERILQQLVKVLDRPPAVAQAAVSSALIQAAAEAGDGQLRLIDVLEAYPLPSLGVNLAAVQSLAEQISHEQNLLSQLYPRMLALGAGSPPDGFSLEAWAGSGQRHFSTESFGFVGRDGSQVEALAYLPQAPAPAPLVVLAPGLNTEMNALLYLGQHLASHGYAVAALNFPFTSGQAIQAAIRGTGTIPQPNAWYGQPHTVSDLIDQVQSRWGERVRTDAVGVLGQSLGGYTAVVLAGASLDWDHLKQGCRALADPARLVLNPAVIWQCQAPGEVVERRDFCDPRVRVAVAVNPVTNPIFSAASMADVAVPLLVIAGSQDVFAPAASQQLVPYSAIRQPDSLLVMQQHGTHLSFLDGPASLPAILLGPDRALARTELRGLSLAFFDRHLRTDGPAPALVPSAQKEGGVTMGADPLPLVVRSQLSRQKLLEVVQDPRLTP
ncbi:alpha/beta hydrolase [Cyanobium sp. ATX 6E8]|uniref:alpha/beta hydrolase n=1 Tax=Cyanobium sp. ATX 6E8 TaxID=2823701 RepID=UPI0020CD5287|nr:alpha/beta hydrolase [Cyanobium sp. ATX 6E8]MCP9942625.1 alpha/beta hydrolase [Cyanobium sp. ATX 6E8]